MEKCACRHFSSLWEWAEGAMDSRTRPWPHGPSFIRAMTELSPFACCQVAILHLAQWGWWARRGWGHGPAAARGQRGAGTCVGTCCASQREACEDVSLINPHCPEGHLYGKGKNKLGGAWQAPFPSCPRVFWALWPPGWAAGGRDSW